MKKHMAIHEGDCYPEGASNGGLLGPWVRFWFTPADPLSLHVVRLLAGLLLLAWLLPLAGSVNDFFGLGGWFDRQAYAEAARLPGGPPKPITWSALYLAGSSPQALVVLYWLALGAVALFALGVLPRLTGVLSWLAVVSFTASPALDSDADALLILLSFYLMLGYLTLGAGAGTLLRRLLGPGLVWPLGLWRKGQEEGGAAPSIGANVALRLLQIHLALVIVTSGLHKLQFGDWWSGLAFWYLLYPGGEAALAQARAHAAHPRAYLALLSLAAYATLAWQLTFPLFAARRRWRVVLLGGAVLGWVGTATLYQLPHFGPAVVIGCLAYVTPGEWRWLAAWVLRLHALSHPRAGATEEFAEAGLAGHTEGQVALVTQEER